GHVSEGLRELEAQRLIYPERLLPEPEYSFQHVLTQGAVYQSIPAPRRADLHRQAGAAIEAVYTAALAEEYEALAYHYERSPDDVKAVEYLLKAGEKARRAYLNEAAIGYFQRALGRLDGATERSDSRLEALEGLGRTLHSVGRLAEAEEQF